jgi:hypothetical protein
MSRRLAARLARIEGAMGVDPVRAALMQRDADAELQVRVETAESVFLNELLAACVTHCLIPTVAASLEPQEIAAATAGHLEAVREIAGERGVAWESRAAGLLERAGDPEVIGASGVFNARVRVLLGQCIDALRATYL